MQRQLCKFCSDSCTFELENKVCLSENLLFLSLATLKRPHWKVQVDRRIPIQITQRTLDIDSRGNDLRKGETCCYFESQGSPKKLEKNCFVWHLQLSKIIFSGVTQGPGKCDMKFYAIPRCVFVIQWEIFKRVFDQWKERLVLSLSEIRMVTFF